MGLDLEIFYHTGGQLTHLGRSQNELYTTTEREGCVRGIWEADVLGWLPGEASCLVSQEDSGKDMSVLAVGPLEGAWKQ